LAEHPVQALLGNPQDAEQLANRYQRVAADEMDDAMMGAAEPIFFEDRIRLRGEVAIGEEQELDALPYFLLVQISGFTVCGCLLRFCRPKFYVSHVDIFCNHR